MLATTRDPVGVEPMFVSTASQCAVVHVVDTVRGLKRLGPGSGGVETASSLNGNAARPSNEAG